MNTLPIFARRLLCASLLGLLAGAAQAQVLRCTDASGRPYYTDQSCPGGVLVAPPRSEQDRLLDEQAASRAREQAQQRALEEQAQREHERWLAQQAAAAAPPPQVVLAESLACRQAREEAAFRAASVSATLEEIHTARYNAALACGQPPPADVVVVQPAPPVVYSAPPVWMPAPPPHWRPGMAPPPPARFGVPINPPPRTVGNSPDPSQRFPYRPLR